STVAPTPPRQAPAVARRGLGLACARLVGKPARRRLGGIVRGPNGRRLCGSHAHRENGFRGALAALASVAPERDFPGHSICHWRLVDSLSDRACNLCGGIL